MTTRTPAGLSAMHQRHVGLGAVMTEVDGWQRPTRYAPVDEELERVRHGVGLCDVSPTGKLLLQGDAINDVLGAAFPKLGRLDVGDARAQSLKTDSTETEVLVAQLAEDELLLLTPPGMAPRVAESVAQGTEQCVHALEITSALAGVKVAGPFAHRLLGAVTEIDISPSGFSNLTCAQAPVAEVHGTLLRNDMDGLLSFELYFGREYGEYMWDSLLDAGEEYTVCPFGVEALNRLAG